MTYRQSILRARIGIHLNGKMPTCAELARKFHLKSSAAERWHALLAAARREFAA